MGLLEYTELLLGMLRPADFRAGIESQPGGIDGNAGDVLRLARLKAGGSVMRLLSDVVLNR